MSESPSVELMVLRRFRNIRAVDNYCALKKKYGARTVSYTDFRYFIDEHYGRYLPLLDQVESKGAYTKLLTDYYKTYKSMY